MMLEKSIKKKAIIFDFDGVVVESETSGFGIIIKVLLDDFRIEVPQELFEKKVGKSTLSFLKTYFGDRLTDEQIGNTYKKIKHEVSSNLAQYIKPHNKVIEYIKNNSDKYDIAIASMNTQAYIKLILMHYGILNNIKVVVTREEVEYHKPSPEVYLKTLSHLNCTPLEALVIEDTPVGVKSANNADIDCIVILNGLNRRDDFRDLKVFKYVSADNFKLS